LLADIKRKKPFYISDFKDALHVQSLASFLFLYFACLTPIITFGGLLAQATGKDLVRDVLCVSSLNIYAGTFNGIHLSKFLILAELISWALLRF